MMRMFQMCRRMNAIKLNNFLTHLENWKEIPRMVVSNHSITHKTGKWGQFEALNV